MVERSDADLEKEELELREFVVFGRNFTTTAHDLHLHHCITCRGTSIWSSLWNDETDDLDRHFTMSCALTLSCPHGPVNSHQRVKARFPAASQLSCSCSLRSFEKKARSICDGDEDHFHLCKQLRIVSSTCLHQTRPPACPRCRKKRKTDNSGLKSLSPVCKKKEPPNLLSTTISVNLLWLLSLCSQLFIFF